jgi:hypothetical protein
MKFINILETVISEQKRFRFDPETYTRLIELTNKLWANRNKQYDKKTKVDQLQFKTSDGSDALVQIYINPRYPHFGELDTRPKGSRDPLDLVIQLNPKMYGSKKNLFLTIYHEMLHATDPSQSTKMNIKYQIIWMTYSIDKMIELANSKKNTHFINACKTNIFDRKISSEYIYKFKNDSYQIYKDEGVRFYDTLDFDFNQVPENLEFCYLPCSLSEKEDFIDEKIYDICYFGTLNNRPGVKSALEELSKKYKIIANGHDISSFLTPVECYNLYKKTKVTLSEQVHPVILEYPVRLGESTSTGCRLFLIEPIDCSDINNDLIPEYTQCNDVDDMINKVSNYIDNYELDISKKLYENFNSTYDTAINFILSKIKNKK